MALLGLLGDGKVVNCSKLVQEFKQVLSAIHCPHEVLSAIHCPHEVLSAIYCPHEVMSAILST